jgi:hypothetical protein
MFIYRFGLDEPQPPHPTLADARATFSRKREKESRVESRQMWEGQGRKGCGRGAAARRLAVSTVERGAAARACGSFWSVACGSL